jgi:acetyltransferase
MRNLTGLGYEGKVYPVNPRETEINGLPCYPSIRDVPDRIELVMITVAAHSVLPVVKEAAARGDVRAVVVVSAGFKETQTEEGKEMERELARLARVTGFRIFGPNCTGVMNTATKLDTTIEPTVEKARGGVSVFSQSGGMAGTILLLFEEQPIPLGFNKWAHVGNMCDVDILDVLSYFGRDPDTSVVVMYMEGFNRGRAFMEVLDSVTPQKPVVILKGGKGELGVQAAFSHTGALAGNDAVYNAVFKRSGATRARDLREVVDIAKAFSMQKLPEGNRICILTEAGGPGTLAMDELSSFPQVRLASISPEAQQRLRSVVPPISLICKPDGYIDITAAAMEEHHCDALDIIMEEEEVDGVILITVPPTFLSPISLAEALVKRAAGAPKPLLTCILAGKWVREARIMMEKAGMPTFDTPEQAVRTMVKMVERKQYLLKLQSRSGKRK